MNLLRTAAADVDGHVPYVNRSTALSSELHLKLAAVLLSSPLEPTARRHRSLATQHAPIRSLYTVLRQKKTHTHSRFLPYFHENCSDLYEIFR